MIQFIWKNWRRRKERLILSLIGALIISAGLTYLVGVSDASRGTIVNTLQDSWTASYDILVRPEGSRSITEEQGLLEPNYLSGMDGGISVEQYEAVKQIQNIEIAAPISMIGYASYTVNFQPIEIEENGIYRQRLEQIMDNGVQDINTTSDYYFAYGDWPVTEENLAGKGSEYGVGSTPNYLSVYTQALLAGVDPEQEAKLVGLEEAVIPTGDSRYFRGEDAGIRTNDTSGLDSIRFPVIVSTHAFDDKQVEFTLERLDIPFDEVTANDTLEEIKDNGGTDYLDTLSGQDGKHYAYSSEEAFSMLVNSITGVDIETGESIETNTVDDSVTWMNFRPSPLEYHTINSPFEDRWPFAYQVEPFANNLETKPDFVDVQSFREPKVFGEVSSDWIRISPDWIGFYDPGKLDISTDPANELPMETYRPATAELVIDANNEPVNPSVTLKPTDNPYDFLTNPPNMLTTIDAAEEILGEAPISAIRVKVTGVTEMNEESQAILEKVAAEIEAETGLITDITLGSSPQLALTYVPAINEDEAIGWLQQPWVNIGSSISVFRESKIGYFGIIASVITVAIIYVWASMIMSLLARRKEFAVLLSLGWRPGQLSKLLFIEAGIIGCFVAMVSWSILGYVYLSADVFISPRRFLLTGLTGLLIYLCGAIIPAISIRNIRPYETIRTGEFSKRARGFFRTQGVFSMAVNHFMGKWRRSLLSIISIALPTGLLALFLHITFRLQGIMYTTWLGQYTALEVSTLHYTAMIVALIIAIMTTSEIMWQNISEREQEMVLLKAIGWKNSSVRLLIWSEGILSGVFAAIIGLAFAFSSMWVMYGQFPTDEIAFILCTGLIPVLIGVIGTIIPAERAVRMNPNRGISGYYSNKKSSDKKLKAVIIGVLAILTGSFIYMMVQVIPEISESASSNEAVPDNEIAPTQGELLEAEKNEDKENMKQEEQNEQEENTDLAEERYDVVLDRDERLSWSVVEYYIDEVNEDFSEDGEAGLLEIEFTYINKDNREHQMNLNQNFTIRSSGDAFGEVYKPIDIEVIKKKNWNEEEGWLESEGEITAVMRFEVPEQDADYLFHFSSYEYPGGILFVLR